MKKILFIIPSLAGGGAERIVSIILNHIDRKRFYPKLILLNKKGEYLDDIPRDIEIFDLNKKSRWDFLSLIFAIREIIKSENPNVVVSFLEYTNILTILSCVFLKRPKIVISERSDPYQYLRFVRAKFFKTILIRLTYKKADVIITISEGIKRSLEGYFKIKGDKIRTIYNPIDIQKIQNLSKEEISHPFFSINRNVPIIISVGRLTKEKNYTLLLRSFALVVKKFKAYLIILGQGELKVGLQNLVRDLKIDDRVNFIGFQKNPFAWMKNSDLFVLSSDFEGFGNVIIEAMACGTPVISTDCPSGPNEIINNMQNGILVPPKDEERLSEAIITLLKDESLRAKIAKFGKDRVKDFRVEKILDEYQEIFNL